MRHLREAHGFETAASFSDHLGLSRTRWLNIEGGYPVSVEVARLLRDKTGITTDYVWYGDRSGLTDLVMARLGFIRSRKVPK